MVKEGKLGTPVSVEGKGKLIQNRGGGKAERVFPKQNFGKKGIGT